MWRFIRLRFQFTKPDGIGSLTLAQMDTVRHLHVLSSQLIRLRRSLTPLLHLAYIIRDQDTQRSAAASAMSAGPRPSDKNHMSRDTQWLAPGPTSDISRPGTPGASDAMSIRNSNLPVGLHNSEQNQGQQGQQGFFSPKTKVYIGDVLDHLELIVGSLDQFVATCDHLTDYVFVRCVYSVGVRVVTDGIHRMS